MHNIFLLIKKKLGLIVVSFLLILSSIISVGYVDSYFEVSKNLDIFATLFKELNVYYVDDTEPGKLMKTGIDAMLKSLDPYTNFYPESDIEDYRFMTTGEYGGIGAMVRKQDGNIIIAEPYEGFPAYKAALEAGDIIEKIDGKDISGYNTSEVSKLLKGAAQTEVKLSIYRKVTDARFDKSLLREDVKIKDVPYYGELDKKVGYIKLNGFTQTASKELLAAFKELKDTNQITSLIIDLRGNGGGLLNEAINIVNIFVEKGQEVVSTKGKIKQWDRVHKALNDPVDTEIPLVVLIDEYSASASEIVSGTLQDLDRAVVVGRKSYGKGLVQQTRSLSYNSQLKVTVAKYYTPSGRCIQRIDYSNKDVNGKPGEIADSLKTEFKTLNNRSVFDGGGIEPDIVVDSEIPAKITYSLISKNLIFNYATEFKNLVDSIPEPFTFEVTVAEYEKFKTFIADKKYDYQTETEKLLDKLKKKAAEDKLIDSLDGIFVELDDKLKRNKSEDVNTFKDEIIRVLENEIVSRYYYQDGRIKIDLKHNDEIKKAIEVLTDSDKYTSILAEPDSTQN
jgi:carboxyl-terminal processing protease